jgi:hypothetical protein
MDRGLVFETPRIWHESFKSHPSMRDLNYRKNDRDLHTSSHLPPS